MVSEAGPVTTREPLRTVVGVGALSVAAGVLVLATVGWRADLLGPSGGPRWLYGLACLVSFALQLSAALLPAPHQVLPASRRARRCSLALLAITVPLGVAVGSATPSALPSTPDVWSGALHCALISLAAATTPALLGVLVLLRLTPRGPWQSALAVGGAAGTLGGLLLSLHCPRSDLTHLILVHATTVVLPAVLLALLVGGRAAAVTGPRNPRAPPT